VRNVITNGLAGALTRLIPSKIRWKIVAPYLVLTLIVAVSGTYLATRVVTDSLDSRFSSQLSEAAVVASDAVVRREQEHLETLRSIAYTIGVSENVEAGDAGELRALIEPIVANDRREYVHVMDSSGTGLLDLHLDDHADLSYEDVDAGPDLPAARAVRNALAGGDALGDKSAQLMQVGDDTILYTAGPLRLNGRVVGVVLVGSSLSTFLPAIKNEALADVTFYTLDGEVLDSTLGPGADEPAAAFNRPARGVGPTSIAGLRQSRSLSGRDFDLLYGELRVRDETIGMFSVALPTSFIASASSNTRTAMMAVFGVATVAVLSIGLAIAHGVTRPLLSLVKSARVVAGGDLSVRASVRSRDEVGTLAASFNVMTERLANQHLQTIRALTSAIDARDPYTAGHSVRVGQLSVEIGRELQVPKRDLQYLEVGGYLHDIGKIGIRDHVLLKEGPLTEEERRLIEDHPRIGLSIIKYVDLADEVLDVVGGHHEKLDGSGYPYGRTDEGISVFARIAAVSDIYDALTTERPYKPALTVERAVEMLEEEVRSGRIDERAVHGLVQALPRWRRRLLIDKSLQGFSMQEMEELGSVREVV
jgi:putative nucleotidyltransferase with HDIG domain